MNYITKNELYEEIRLHEGIVLKISKYELLSWDKFKRDQLKGNTEKIGSKLYKLKNDITREEFLKGTKTYKEGTYIIRDMPCKKCEEKNYTYELTSSGGSIFGDKDSILRKLKSAIDMIEKGE